MKSIETYKDLEFTNPKEHSADENGRYLVRFYSHERGRWCYVNAGTEVEWWETTEFAPPKRKHKKAIIDETNSEKYYIAERIEAENPTSNKSISHYLKTTDGRLLATQVCGWDCYFSLYPDELENERID